jgi:DNA-binding LacI/PurR family transcriptional regulator
LSKSTVALALRGDPVIAKETRRRVLAEAKRQGYVADAAVSQLMAQLRAGRPARYRYHLALVNATSRRDAFTAWHTYRLWKEGATARAHQLGYGLDEFWLHAPGINPRRLAQIFAHRRIRGLILAPFEREMPDETDEFWSGFACAVLGSRPIRPELHFASVDHFSVALLAARRLIALGYRRLALATFANHETLIDRRFSAALWSAAQEAGEPVRALPALFWTDEAATDAWYAEHRPDAVLSLVPMLLDWARGRGLRVPRDLGLVYLDHGPYVAEWTAIDQRSMGVGAAAVDLVVGQLHRGESGVPAEARGVLLEGSWVPGRTTRARAPA